MRHLLSKVGVPSAGEPVEPLILPPGLSSPAAASGGGGGGGGGEGHAGPGCESEADLCDEDEDPASGEDGEVYHYSTVPVLLEDPSPPSAVQPERTRVVRCGRVGIQNWQVER